MGTLVNPYIAGAPVTEAKMFFGREDVFDWIENSISGQYADHILVIHGQRRVGKTSVLKQLGNRLPGRFIPVFFDLQGRTHTTLDRFLWWLAREIVRVLKQDRGIEIAMPEKEAFAADLEFFEHHFLPGLKPGLGDSALLLTFDEFDNLEESEIKEELARPLIDYLRRLMGNAGVNFIFSIGSSGRKLENMQAAYTEFFKTALYKKISFLNEDQTRNLVTRPVEGIIEYDRRAVTRLYQITGGHPYFTQLTCHELFAKCQRTDERFIHESDVESVLEDVVERGTVNLKFVWDEASDIEKWSLAALAQLDKVDNRALADFLRKQRVRFSDTDLTSGLLHLREKDILTRENHFVIHLMKIWLQKNRPMEQAREELTEVNPIANRYIEIGLEFRDAGIYDKAIESFKEALAVAKDNIQAQVNIALTHMDQRSYSDAVAEFEKALVMDDEDVSARAGLCEAQLALGDAALQRGRTRDAIQSYRRVLVINAEHTEARQRMAEIASQRAEKALIDGKDEEAISAFGEALKYTPEDPALTARVEQVRTEKKAKVLATLLARSEKEANAKNWEAALRPLEEAVLLAPEDLSIQQRLLEAKALKEQVELDALLAKAEAAAKSGKWDTAIESLTAVLTARPDGRVDAKLAEVRARQREARLSELKTQARGLARVERFEAALTAWEKYLAFEPDDRAATQAEMERVRRAQALERSYAEAQQAYERKNYDQAVSLLKGIINQDENYKDASRLLAECIELRRTARRWWQNKLLLWGAGSAVLAAVAWFVLRPGGPLMGAFSALPTAASAVSLVSPVPATATAVQTITPAPTPTPLPLTWTRLSSGQFLPRDAITTVVVDPTDPGVIFVGTQNAGIYKSIDGGLSWQPVHNGLGRAAISRLVFDPANAGILYASTRGNLYRTTDRGASWQELAPGREFIDGNTFIVVDPQDSQRLYYATQDSVYRSTDGGKNWQMVKSPEDCPGQIFDHAFSGHISESGVLFASEWGTQDVSQGCQPGLYRSTDGGETWELIGLEGKKWIAQIAVGLDLQGNEVLYVTDTVEQPTALYTSRDGGQTWTTALEEGCPGNLLVDPDQPATVYCGRFRSGDGGSTWEETLKDPPPAMAAIAIPGDGETIIAGADAGLYISADGGKTWAERSSGLAGVRLDLRMDPSEPATFYANLLEEDEAGRKLYRSTDEGQTWDPLERGRGFAIDDSGGIYRIEGNQLLYSQDKGETWNSSPLPLAEEVTGMGINLSTPGAVFLAFPGQHVYYTTDQGQSWQESRITESKNDFSSARFFFGSARDQMGYMIPFVLAYRTADLGRTWEQCEHVSWTPPGQSVLTIDPRDSKMIVLAVQGKGLLRSEDGCQSWQESNTGLGSLYVSTLAIDPNNPDTLYAGTDGGAYISLNHGRSWNQINDGLLGATVVYSIVVDGNSNVYAATPYGIFRLEGD